MSVYAFDPATACSTRNPDAAPRAGSSSLVLPIPASPRTTSTPLRSSRA
jgi:hypothetical protein